MSRPSRIHAYISSAWRYTLLALQSGITFPILVLYKIVGVFLYLILNRFGTKLNKYHHDGYTTLKKTTPQDKARQFINKFDSDELTLLECGYSQALYKSKREMKWLLCYIQSEEHEDHLRFKQNVLLSPQFVDFVNSHDFLVWGGDISQSEAFQVANGFKVTKFPFLGLLTLTVNSTPTANGVTTSAPVLSLVSKVQGYQDVYKVITKFSKAYDKYNPTLITLRHDHEQIEQDRQVRRAQDEAFERSLNVDRERTRQHQLRQQRERDRELYLKWRTLSMKPEPDTSAKGTYARVAIRLPDGSRTSRRFNKDISVEEIYAFAEASSTGIISLEIPPDVEKPEGYEHEYSFRLIQVMPRMEVSCDDTRIEDSVVWPNGNLIMEEKE
ncbi:unnamed protein product [Kuraishia capsulata CBS 1993]|uniref:UBX domain-containing protein n=1 Tax=Kuraishia capsulata CBS 1993 TaxID=1382522 RepID=W6MIA5_9ASCO|nr:uncharacterized protein KUCA_T00002145001 [Kuraishia capsulata CBS 1993]CDK26174.1 unnamed protein product [Kuraishia capsulata CBS 1993]